MPNYQESAIAGTKYLRAKAVHVNNPLEGTKSVVFEEEEVFETGEDSIRRPHATLHKLFDETTATTVFDLLNPVDNSVIGSMQYQEVYAVLYSLYFHLAAERDAAAAEEVDPLTP